MHRQLRKPNLQRKFGDKTMVKVYVRGQTKSQAKASAKRIKKGTDWTSKGGKKPRHIRVVKSYGKWWVYETRRK